MRRAAACVIIPPEVGHGRGIPRPRPDGRRDRRTARRRRCAAARVRSQPGGGGAVRAARRSRCGIRRGSGARSADRVRLPARRRGQRAGGGGGRRLARAAHLRRDVHHRQRRDGAHRTIAGSARHHAGGLPDQRWTERRARRNAVGDCRRPARGAGRHPAAARAHRQERVRGGRASWPGTVDEAGEQPDQRRQHGDGVRGAGAGCERRAGSRVDGEGNQRLHRPQQCDSRQGAESGAAWHVRLRREGLHDGEGHRARVCRRPRRSVCRCGCTEQSASCGASA